METCSHHFLGLRRYYGQLIVQSFHVIVEIESAFERKSEQVENNDDECLFYVVASYDRDSTWVPGWIENNTVSIECI